LGNSPEAARPAFGVASFAQLDTHRYERGDRHGSDTGRSEAPDPGHPV